MKKIDKLLLLSMLVVTCGFVVIVIGWMNNSGWYCDYCLKGTPSYEKSIEQLGNIPCEASIDKCHHITYHLIGPKKQEPIYKYLK